MLQYAVTGVSFKKRVLRMQMYGIKLDLMRGRGKK
jgi:hypothetical protein